MSDIKSFAVIGGDSRMLYCARSIAEDGFRVCTSGFSEKTAESTIPDTSLSEAVREADALILPLPVSRNGDDVFAPFCSDRLLLSPLMRITDKPVFCGTPGYKGLVFPENFFCYADRDDFKSANAVPTAEGAVAAAMREYKGTVTGARLLVSGYGRIGKVLSSMLRGMGACVAASARKKSDLEMIKAAGLRAERTDDIKGRYDIVFNTVPDLIFDRETIAKTVSGGIIIDLASMPGGVDDLSASLLGTRVYHELSLPGRVAPETAGIIIKNTVYNIIEEEGL